MVLNYYKWNLSVQNFVVLKNIAGHWPWLPQKQKKKKETQDRKKERVVSAPRRWRVNLNN